MTKRINKNVKSCKQYVRSLEIILVAFMIIFISGCKSKTDETAAENNKNQTNTNISQEQKSTSSINDESTSSTDKNGQSEKQSTEQNSSEVQSQDGLAGADKNDETKKSQETITQTQNKPQENTTQKPTQTVTQKPAEAPTQKPTQAPTQKPTEAPTQKPTQASTQAPIQAPTVSGDTQYAAEVESNVASYMNYYREVLSLVNAIRAEAGVAPLELDIQLCKAATYRSVEMEYANLFSHTRPDGSRCFTIFETYGINYRTAGENIAAGQITPQEVVEAWKNSSGHYANMINENFTKLGVGLSKKGTTKYRAYWTQLFTG